MNVVETEEAIEHQRALKNDLIKRLRVLERQRARLGDEFAPAHILTSIDDVRDQIEQCDEEIEQLQYHVDNISPENYNIAIHEKPRFRFNIPSQVRIVLTVIAVALVATLARNFPSVNSGLPSPVDSDLIPKAFNQPIFGVNSTWFSDAGALTLQESTVISTGLTLTWRLTNTTSESINLPFYYLRISVFDNKGNSIKTKIHCEEGAECRGEQVILSGSTINYTNEIEFDSKDVSVRSIFIYLQSNSRELSKWIVLMPNR